MKHFNMKLSDELHKRFKIACAHEGKELSEVVRKAIEDFVARAEKKLLKK
jgi:predicted DNA-binding protein